MKWSVRAQWLTADNNTMDATREFVGSRLSVQHWGDRRGLVQTDSQRWHICGLSDIYVEKIEEITNG